MKKTDYYKICEQKLKYLDSVLTITGGRPVPVVPNEEIERDLILGGVQQVLTSKFGYDRYDIEVITRWLGLELE